MPDTYDRTLAAGPGRPARPPAYANPADAQHAVQLTVDAVLSGRARPRVLEAGAGKRTRLHVPAYAHVVGVDTDETAINRNARLDERVITDLGSYAAPAASFDLITCWYVLEHVNDPRHLLERFALWTAPGGLVVIAVPNLTSLKAVFTKVTPHPFHVWFRRRVLGVATAGMPGHGPYPTTLRAAIAPAAMRRAFVAAGLRPVFEGYFEDPKQVQFRRRIGLTGRVWGGVRTAVRVLSAGRLQVARTEYLAVFQRP